MLRLVNYIFVTKTLLNKLELMAKEDGKPVMFDDDNLKDQTELELTKRLIMKSIELFVNYPENIRPVEDVVSIYDATSLISDPLEPSIKIQVPTLKRRLLNVSQNEYSTQINIYNDEVEACFINDPTDFLKDNVGSAKLTAFNMSMRIVHGGSLNVDIYRSYKTNKVIETSYDLLSIAELNEIPLKSFSIENLSMFEALQQLVSVPFDHIEPNYPN